MRLLLQNIFFERLIIVILSDPRAFLLKLFYLLTNPRLLYHLSLLVKLGLHLADQNQLIKSVLRTSNSFVKHTFHVLSDFGQFIVLLFRLQRFFGQLNRRP